MLAPGSHRVQLRCDVDDPADGDDDYQALIEAELSSVIGTGGHEQIELGRRCATDTGRRRSRRRPGIWNCVSGSCGPGRSSPGLLERRRVDQSLFAVIMEAYLHGTSHLQGRRPGQGCRRRQRDQHV
jgi:hypothetical protein